MIANTAAIVPYPVAIGQAQYPPVAKMFELMAAQVGSLSGLRRRGLRPAGGQPPDG